MTRNLLVGAVTLILVGCADVPAEVTVDLIPVPTQSPGPLFGIGGPSGCPTALLEGTLLADDDTGFVVGNADGFRSPVVWPHEWVARDDDGVREILNEHGAPEGREGDQFRAGGGFYPPDDWFYPCGGIEITPAS